jgi:hypothetical protein
MFVRFDVRTHPNGWTVHDNTTSTPAVVNGLLQIGLSREEADKTADLLNLLDATRAIVSSNSADTHHQRQHFRVIEGGKSDHLHHR